MEVSDSLAHDRFDSRFDNDTSKSHSNSPLQENGSFKLGRTTQAQYVQEISIATLDERIVRLKARGAERCAPGDLAKAEQLLVRVKRQWVGNLHNDALNDIERLEHRLEVVDGRVFHGKCQPGGHVIAHRSISDRIVTKSVATTSGSKPLSLKPRTQPIPPRLTTTKGTR